MKKTVLSKEEEFNVLNVNGLGILYCEDIYLLDLGPIKKKLQNLSGIRSWSKKKCESTELAYKRFLTLKRMFPHKLLVPTPCIHEFWRQHYLEKEKYAVDCHLVFGHYMGKLLWQQKHLRVSEDHLELAHEETQHLYRTYFRDQHILHPES